MSRFKGKPLDWSTLSFNNRIAKIFGNRFNLEEVEERMIERGYEVILGSRKFRELPNWIKHTEILQTEWNNKLALFEICEGVDVVIHTAGMNAQACASDPEQALAFNGTVTADLVSSAVKQGVKKFIYLSTAHVYRSPLVGTISDFLTRSRILSAT